jgi:thiol-disulfide isomerase/thioredoxin
MRSPVLLGAALALIVGALAVFAVIGLISAQPTRTPPPPTHTPGTGSLGLYTPPPTPTPTPVPTPTLSGQPSATIGTQVGNLAPRLVLPHLAGGELDTANAAGTPLWINFMASWCPPCREELPMMQGIQLQLEDELEIVLVDVGEPEDVVFDFMVDVGVDLSTGLDIDQQAQQAWGAFALPVHFFIDADGIVREVIYGGAPREVFEQALQQIVPEATIQPEPTEGQ